MNRCIGALKPPIEPHELLFIKPPRANLFRLSRNPGGGIIREPETALRCPSVIVLRFHAPAIGSVHIAPDVVGHCLLAALIYRADHFNDFFGLDFARGPVAAECVGDLIEALLRFLPGAFLRVLEVLNIGFE